MNLNIFKPTPTQAGNPVIAFETDLEKVQLALLEIRLNYYTIPLTAAKRIQLGSTLRKLSPEVIEQLSSVEVQTLKRFHTTSSDLITFLVAQRASDVSNNVKTLMTFEEVKTFAKFTYPKPKEA